MCYQVIEGDIVCLLLVKMFINFYIFKEVIVGCSKMSIVIIKVV